MKRLGCGLAALSLILVGMLAASGWWLLANLVRVVDHEPIDAIIVDLVPRVDSDGDTVYAPVYEYVVDGVTYHYTSKVSLGGLVVPDIGDHRTLLYDPDNPAEARVRNWFLLLILPGILAVVPLLILAAMAGAWLRRRRAAIPAGVGPGFPPLPVAGGETGWAPVDATFMGAEPSQMDASGRVRYRATASAEIDGVTRRFLGDWQDEDPTLLFMSHGNTVVVLVDPDDPGRYRMVMPDPDGE
jgi:hypothetical protein